MERIEVKQLQPVFTYRTIDGKVFDKEWQAIEHENELWFEKNVDRDSYSGKVLYIYRATSQENYDMFIKCLCQMVSFSFNRYRNSDFWKEDKLVARFDEYNNDGEDYVTFQKISTFIEEEREELEDKLKDLKYLESIY